MKTKMKSQLAYQFKTVDFTANKVSGEFQLNCSENDWQLLASEIHC